ncbi:hypothetical protein [Halopiger aswanensis]|nr:hypothetical protein [Halopiger aswanensis]
MIEINHTPRYIYFPLNSADPVAIEEKPTDATVEVKLYEVELAAHSGAVR